MGRRGLWIAVLTALSLLISTGSAAQLVRPAADLTQIDTASSTFPGSFMAAESQTFFIAGDSVHGQELWRTEGTPGSTRLVTDLCPGLCGSFARPLATFGDQLYFATLGQLWKTDGTDQGTVFIAQPGATLQRNAIHSGVMLGDKLLFVAPHDELGRALWTSDGTAEGTVDIPISFDSVSGPVNLTVIGNQAYFSTVGSFGDSRLWRTDGTANGTTTVKQLCDSCYVHPSSTTVLGNRLFFVASDGTHGQEPWISDGTSDGTHMLADLVPGAGSSYPNSVAVLGNTLYGTFGSQCSGAGCLFRTDGTPAGTRLAPELFPPLATGNPVRVQAAGSTLYLRIFDSPESLWAIGGPDGLAYLGDHGTVQFLGTDARGTLLYRTYDSTHWMLRATDGSPETTRTVLEPAYVSELGSVSNRTLLVARANANGLGEETELWITNGTHAGTSLLLDPTPPTSHSNPSQMVAWGRDLALVALEDGSNRRSVWLFDGQSPQSLASDFYPGPLTVVGDQLYVGTALDPGLLVFERGGESRPLAIPGSPTELVSFRDRLLAAAGSPGQGLWTTDGTQDGTELIIDVHPGWSWGCPILCPGPFPEPFPNNLTPFDDQTLFVAFEEDGGPGQLWATDGTTDGTRVVREFEMDPGAGRDAIFDSPDDLTRVGDWVYFTAFERETGREVWRTDGTTAGTTLVADLTADGESAEPIHLVAWTPAAGPPSLVWVLRRDSGGDQLWRSSADGLGAQWISDLGGTSAEVHELVASGDRLYLAITTPDLGRELWVSDGTLAGTRPLDLRTDNPRGSGVAYLTPIPGGVFFAAASGPDGEGFEPWVSGGTVRNTFLAADVYPGISGSNPGPGTVVSTQDGDRLYFAADDGDIGRELFVLDLDALGDLGCPDDRLCLQQGRFEITMGWHTASGASGTARRVSSTDDSGLLWFFEADNWEAMVKVLDGCGINEHFWVFAATSTNVGYTLTVEDLLTGERKTYTNPPGESAAAITDTEALATCP